MLGGAELFNRFSAPSITFTDVLGFVVKLDYRNKNLVKSSFKRLLLTHVLAYREAVVSTQ